MLLSMLTPVYIKINYYILSCDVLYVYSTKLTLFLVLSTLSGVSVFYDKI